MKRYYCKIEGMMCGHCERTVEKAASDSGAVKIKANHSKGTLEFSADEKTPIELFRGKIEESGYKVIEIAEDRNDLTQSKMKITTFLIIAAFAVIALLVIKNTLGFNFIPGIPASASYAMIFVIGAFTSLHCLVMCGGINLSQSIKGVNEKFKGAGAALLYNGGRIISYTIIGAAAGAAGSAMNFSPSVKSLIMAIAAVFMIFMGLRIAGLLSFIKLPFSSFLACSRFTGYSPFVVGLLNGLMPCGPLQAAQLYALSTGSAAAGAAAMLFFALGTFPLMFAVGALSGLISRRFTSMMYKAGGFLIILMALVMLVNSANLSGKNIISQPGGGKLSSFDDKSQTVISMVGSSSYENVVVQKAIPAKLIFRVDEKNLNGCNNAIVIPDLGIQKRLSAGDNVIEFTPRETGSINFSCWMGMISGQITVVDDITINAGVPVSEKENSGARGGCCGGSGKFKQYNK